MSGGASTWRPGLLRPVALLAACAALSGCSRSSKPGGSLGIFPMGERVSVGPLIYTVQDAEWHDQLGEGPGARMPKHRFLVIRLSVTNSGIREADIPPMSVITPAGQVYEELSQGEGVAEWLGYWRTVRAAATEHGRVLFDAPSGSYRLRVGAGGDDEETFALIEIPYQPPPALPAPAVGSPPR